MLLLALHDTNVQNAPPNCGYQREQAVQLRGGWAELEPDDPLVQSGHNGGAS